jgi:hypothetical protein
MPTSEYFRRQSDICLRLSLVSSSDEVATRLIAMAQDYAGRAEETEAELRLSLPKTIAEDWNQID